MAIRKILLYPDPFLRRVAREVCAFDEALAWTVADLIDTMRSLNHCVGVAATQAAIDQRIVVMDTSSRDKASHGLIVLVNPVVQKKEGAIYTKEGCLSLPSFLGRVQRSEAVTMAARKADGTDQTWHFSGLEAICAQHELDHLDGVLFIDKLNSLRTDLFLRSKK